MRKCIDSLLVGGEDVEIIIVDDGSKDGTAAIADEYAAAYPDIIKAVHQENGGHGEAVNTGLRNAGGLYYKVVDSDDWLDEESLKNLGLGVQPPEPSLGLMLADAQSFLQIAPWYAIFPGLTIVIMILGFSMISEGLRVYQAR